MKGTLEENVQRLLDEYALAIQNGDFLECIKKVGGLELLGFPEVDHLVGFAYHMQGDSEKAIEFLSKVNSDSSFYKEAMNSLAIQYMLKGDYIHLEEILSDEQFACSPMDELDIRIKCLEHVKSEDMPELKHIINESAIRAVEADKYTGHEAETFFSICSMLSVCLVAAGECINQCAIYQIKSGEAFAINADIKKFVDEYEKWAYILTYSKYLKIFKMSDSIDSLADCVSINRNWEDKIAIFKSEGYVQQVLQIILMLCRPEVHSQIDAYNAVEKILEAYIHIEPRALAQLIDHYFEIVKDAYIEGRASAAQYLGYVYAEILSTGRDSFSLKERIDCIRKAEDTSEWLHRAENLKLGKSMSRKGNEALINAERSFNKTKGDVPGVHDYSALSLQFFRVIEIEYCEKIVKPLAASCDLNQMLNLAAKADEDWKRRSWERDCHLLEKISSGKQDSFEVGAIRTLLGHLVNYKTCNDDCALYISQKLEQYLSTEGKKALKNRLIMNIIDEATLEKYRVPGAHTGYLPYSVACDSRQYVLDKLPIIETWFN